MKSFVSVLLLAALLLIIMCGCINEEKYLAPRITTKAKQEEEQQEDTVVKDTYRVGLSLQDDSPFVIRVGKKLQELITNYGDNIELVVYNGMVNPDAQIAHVESFISSGFDVIILNPISYEQCATAVTIAKNAGVPIITTIVKTNNPTGYLSYVGSDHYESGVIEARMVAKHLNGYGKIVILEGVIGIDAQTERYRGYMDIFKYYPNIEVVATQTAAWQRDEAYAIVENWIRNRKDFSVVLSENDNMAMGAIEAIEEYGKQDEIAVFGIDGDADAMHAVSEGRLKGTVFHNAGEIADTLFDCILKLRNSETIKQSYIIPFEKVTKDNVHKYLSKY